MELNVDPGRLEKHVVWGNTGICVRAKESSGKWGSYDIVLLTAESLLTWLRSRGGVNPWAEDTVGILLGHGGLHNRENHGVEGPGKAGDG